MFRFVVPTTGGICSGRRPGHQERRAHALGGVALQRCINGERKPALAAEVKCWVP